MSIKNGYLFDKDGIEYLCGLIRDMNSISDGISDINIASNSTFSSLKIDNLIKQAVEDNNEYTDRVVSALTHLVAEKIDFEPTLDNTADKKNTLLLYSVNSDTTFNQYLRLENELLDLGTTSMDLSSYYTITQADSKFILKTEYDSLVSSINDINDTLGDEALTTTSQTVTEAINELVKARTNMEIIDLQGGSVLDYAKTFDALTYNSFYANNCYDLPNNENYGYCYVEVSQDPLYRNINFTSPTTGRRYTNTIGASTTDPAIFGEWSGWHEELIKEDVVTTVDADSTDKQIPSAKAVYDNIKNNGLIWQGTQQLQNSQESSIFNYCKSNFIEERICCFRLEPKDGSGYFGSSSVTIIYCLSSVNYGWILGISDKTGIPMAIIQIVGSEIKKWQRICTTSVADVPVTNIAPADTTTFVNFVGNASCNYYVKNGVCYVSLWGVKIASTGESKQTGVILPKCANNKVGVLMTGNGDATAHAFAFITEAGELSFNVKDANIQLYGSFSYPIAE